MSTIRASARNTQLHISKRQRLTCLRQKGVWEYNKRNRSSSDKDFSPTRGAQVMCASTLK